MKTLNMGGLGLTMSLTALLIGTGCVQQAVSSPEQTNAAASNAPALGGQPAAVETPSSSDTNAALVEPEIPITEADYTPVTTAKTAPPNVRTNGPLGEIIRMTDSGVDEAVLLAVVTNSPSLFALDADEIIYLNDIGVPSSVVTAMIHHDLQMKAQAAGTTSTWSTPETAQAEPPANESAAADIAPQPAEAPPAPATGQTAQAPAPPETQVNYNSFYSSLSPYGNWVYIEGYGNVWQPSVVVSNPSWSPYLDNGRWIYSDYGWYWLSDYTWGWAPFHYGRWFRHYRLGWCWYPDYVWGPSWVTWRYNGGYCGWAPLPPGAWWVSGVGLTWWGGHVGVGFSFGLGYNCYSYVPWNHFHNHHLHHYRAHYDEARRIHAETVVSTRIQGNRRHIVNNGLVAEHVSRATGIPVQRVHVRETDQAPRGIRKERLDRDGNTVSVYRPQLAVANRNAPERTMRSSGGSARSIGGTSLAESRNLPASRLAGRTAPTSTPNTATTATGERRTWERPIPATSKEPRPMETVRVNRQIPQRGITERKPSTTSADVSPAQNKPDPANTAQGRLPSTLQRRGTFANTPSVTTPRTAERAPTVEHAPQAPSAQPAQTQPSAATRAWQARQNQLQGQRLAPQAAERPSPQIAAPATAQPQTRSAFSTPPQRNVWNRSNISAQQAPTAPAQVAPQANRGAFAEVQRPSAFTQQEPIRRETYNAPIQQRQYSAPAVQQAPRTQFTPPPVRQTPAPVYQAPSRSFSAPQANSAPSQSFSAPSRSFSSPAPAPAPSRSYSAPSQSASGSSSSRSSGGGGDSSGSSRPSRQR